MGHRKSGALSLKDMQTIKNMVDTHSVSDIAKSINRHDEPVQRYIDRERIGPQYNRKTRQDISERNQKQIMTLLRKRPFYKELKEQLTIAEIDQFEENWVTIVADMNSDVLASEELDLKELLILEILKGRLLKESKLATEERNRARTQLDKEMKVDKSQRDKESVRLYKEIIASSQNYLSTFNKDLNTLLDKTNKIKTSLQKTRAQRTEHLEKAAIDFKGYIKLLQDMETRKRIGREMEIIKASKAKKEQDLSGYYSYANQKVDRPILNAETIENETTSANERKTRNN